MGNPKRERARRAKANSQAAKRVPRGGAKQDLPLLGHLGGCWCGEPSGHDWPGRAQGAPHPR